MARWSGPGVGLDECLVMGAVGRYKSPLISSPIRAQFLVFVFLVP